MNLKDATSQVYGILNYNPTLAAYRDLVADWLANHYGTVNGSQKWLFLQKEVDFPVYATVEGSSTNLATWTQNSNAVAVSGPTIGSWWRGQTIIGPNGDEFLIADYLASSATAATIYLSGTETHEPESYTGTTAASSQSWSVRFDRYALPADCLEPLMWVQRYDDRGPIPFIDRMRGEELYLDRDDEGVIEAFVEDEHIIDRAPDVPFTATAVAGGSLLANTEYEYGHTFTWEGRESPMSVTVSATTTASNLTINLAGLENTQVAGVSTGRGKVIYRRDKTNNGRWLRLSTGTDSTTTYSDDNSPAPSNLESLAYYPQGGRQYVRPWRRAGTDHSMKLRYIFTPRPLVADSDVPVWPPIYHPLLVYRVIEEMANSAGQNNLAAVYRLKAAELTARMMNDKRCIERSNRIRVRQAGFGTDIGTRVPRFSRVNWLG